MEYAQAKNEQMLPSRTAYRDAPAACIDKPRIATQLDQLDKVLQDCHNTACSISSAADRILGPTPTDGVKGPGTPPSSTLEQRFAELIGVAEGLAHRLNQASTRLNQAV